MKFSYRTSRRVFRTALGLLLALGLSTQGFPTGTASAAWPPPEDATSQDLSDPENWPNDPGYGWSMEGDSGQWNYYSFMVPNPNVRPAETATGMSVDLAWRLTQGDPRVIIGVTDSGIKWDEADIIEAAYINHRELQAFRPLRQDGSDCEPLAPEFYPDDDVASLAGFDCNGDGIVSVADYAETPSLLPEASEGHPKGDKNNGVLDAGDLILNFSDGIDDDENGYTDDISGWDFMKDDNDPYDDTRYGHGTGEATDSTSRANNGMGGAGGCNQCRVMHLRVGDSFITDANDFGQAVIFGTDSKVKLIQSALGTVNNSQFVQEAIDYGWEHGVIVVASMADENSRHHNMPTVSNHTLPVHAIQFAGEKITETRTFLEYHPCSNFGGQNFLSAAGRSCSSEAVGQTSGIVGLVWSAGLEYERDLTPGEVFQLMIMSADDIDVPESREPNPIDKFSQPGFDQRFGYGRVNANRAVEMVRDGKIPPEVDVVSPTWFSVLYKDQVTAPIAIEGTVRALRASTYDYVVEWAPGVEPLDGEFQTLSEKKGVAGAVVSGQSEPLAEIDIRQLDGFPIPKEKWDVDSPLGENQHTMTVRVRSVAHYGEGIGDVKGEIRRTYYVHTDPDVVAGFPMYVGAGGEASPKLHDFDGDGAREIVYMTAGGEIHVVKVGASGPENLPGFPFRTERMDGFREENLVPGEPSYLGGTAYLGAVDPDHAREALSSSAPAVADLDGDGKAEIIAASYAGTIYVVNRDGSNRAGFPKRLPRVPSCSLDPENPTEGPCMSVDSRIARGMFAAPVIADMDHDGNLDIIAAAFDGNIYVFNKDGEDVAGFPVNVLYDGKFEGQVAGPNRITTPAIADFNGDGTDDLVVGTNQLIGTSGNSGAVYLVDGRGTAAPTPYFTNWPITMTSLNIFPLVAEGITNSPVTAKVEGVQAAIAHGNASSPLILPLDPGAQNNLNAYPERHLPTRTDATLNGLDSSSTFGPLTKAAQPNTMFPLFSQPSLGDLDQDGAPEVIATGGSLNLAINLQSSGSALKGENLLAMWNTRTGKMMPASPMVLEDFTFINSSAVADLTGDGYPEVIVGSGGYYLHAFDGCGREPEGFPKFTGQWIIPTPAVGDIDGDGTMEVVVGTRSGWLYAWHTGASTSNLVEWESYHHDNHNTGNYEFPLAYGGDTHPSEVLTAELCEPEPTPEPTDDRFVASGGCACNVAAPAHSGAKGLALGLAVAALLTHRRGRRTGRRL